MGSLLPPTAAGFTDYLFKCLVSHRRLQASRLYAEMGPGIVTDVTGRVISRPRTMSGRRAVAWSCSTLSCGVWVEYS